MLALGHISEYLIYWGYLYDHLQQGWGAFNSLIKTFLFCRTGCGRAGNKGHGSKSQLHPIAHWLSYCVILCGYLYHDIVEQNKKIHKTCTIIPHDPVVLEEFESDKDTDESGDIHVW